MLIHLISGGGGGLDRILGSSMVYVSVAHCVDGTIAKSVLHMRCAVLTCEYSLSKYCIADTGVPVRHIA